MSNQNRLENIIALDMLIAQKYSVSPIDIKMGRRLLEDNDVYRVVLNSNSENVTVTHTKVDTKLDGTYNSVEDLPQWMQDKLAVLAIMSFEPPTSHVKDVGQRISRFVFWVYK